jgi:hypothetical protein
MDTEQRAAVGAIVQGLCQPPPREELLELYKSAIEEYRFQVKLNVDRSRDYFVANSAIIAVAVTLVGQAKLPFLAGVVFLVGVVVSLLSALGTHTQHEYYRAARDRIWNLENQLGYSRHELGMVIAGHEIARQQDMKTAESRSQRRRFGRVTTFNYVILCLVCFVNIAGACWSFWRVGHPELSEPAAATATAPKAPTSPGQAGPPCATPRRP